jgi:hypothetical protein
MSKLLINGVDGKYPVPNVNKKKYKFTAFEQTMTFSVKPSEGGAEVRQIINVKSKIEAAWNFIITKAAVHPPCNAYFKTLARKKTLKEVLDEGDITLHCLEPKKDYNLNDLPDANTAGRDIGIDPTLLLESDSAKLGCILVHELAHVGGATTNVDDQDAIAAEKALKFCRCGNLFRPEALGILQERKLHRDGGSRIV